MTMDLIGFTAETWMSNTELVIGWLKWFQTDLNKVKVMVKFFSSTFSFLLLLQPLQTEASWINSDQIMAFLKEKLAFLLLSSQILLNKRLIVWEESYWSTYCCSDFAGVRRLHLTFSLLLVKIQIRVLCLLCLRTFSSRGTLASFQHLDPIREALATFSLHELMSLVLPFYKIHHSRP